MVAAEVASTSIQRFRPQVFTISDFIGWYERGELVLSPDFQRRQVWSLQAKSYLIDSIVRGMPIPQVSIRETIHPSARRIVREVVDGQQRLSAIIDFIEGKFTVLPVHNPEIAREKYAVLPEGTQRVILGFPLTVNVLIGNSDADVLEIFSRINAYSITLNRQEKLNAEYSGAFKQAMHRLARRHLAYWRKHKILSSTQIARMGDVDLTADLVATMMTNLHQGSAHIGDHYKKYDEEFLLEDVAEFQFNHILSLIEEMVGVPIEETEFRRTPLFYPLFTATYDTVFGFRSESIDPERILDENGAVEINIALQELSDKVRGREVEGNAGEFVRATQRGTNLLSNREIRHEFLKNIIHPAFAPLNY